MILGKGLSLGEGDVDAEFELTTASFDWEELGTVRDEDTVLLDGKLEEEDAFPPRLTATMLSLPFAFKGGALGVAVDFSEEIVRRGGGPSPLPMVDGDALDDAADEGIVELPKVEAGCERAIVGRCKSKEAEAAPLLVLLTDSFSPVMEADWPRR